MELVLLTEELVKALALNKEAVSVKEFASDDEDTIVIQVMIDNSIDNKFVDEIKKRIGLIR